MWNWDGGPLEGGIEGTYCRTIDMPLKNEKPPIGLMPRGIWLQNRVTDITGAIDRRVAKYLPIPMEWVDELANTISEYEDANPQR